MTAFEEVCLLSCENWIDSFPAEIPKHNFSKKHNEKMAELFYQEPKENKHKLSKKTIRILLIAAILLALTATTVFAIPASRKAVIENFLNHSEYEVLDKSKAKPVKSLTVNYVPEGFIKVDEDFNYQYYENGERNFFVEKCMINAGIGFDTETYDSENIEINERDAVFFGSKNNVNGIIFNDGNYIYKIDGHLDKEELVKIAQNIE